MRRAFILSATWVLVSSACWWLGFADEPPTAGPSTPSPAADVPLADAPRSVADLKAMEQHVQQLLDKLRPCTVSVSGGSGVVVTADGYVLTVGHIGQRAGRNVTITFPDGRRVKAKTLGNNLGVDAGLMKIVEDGQWPHAAMGHSQEVKRGQWCLALGYPVSYARGQQPAVRLGRVLRSSPRAIITDCTIMGGDSGGPLFDLQGRVIGIGSRVDDPLDANVHVPVDAFHEAWDRLLAGEDWDDQSPTVAYLGVTPNGDAGAAKIGRVFDGSAADKAGLRAGDVILKFGGRELKTYDELPPLVRRRQPGAKVEVEVQRGDETLHITVTLGSRRR